MKTDNLQTIMSLKYNGITQTIVHTNGSVGTVVRNSAGDYTINRHANAQAWATEECGLLLTVYGAGGDAIGNVVHTDDNTLEVLTTDVVGASLGAADREWYLEVRRNIAAVQ